MSRVLRFLGLAKKSPEALKAAADFIQQEISGNKAVVFSKRYCPYCIKVKQTLDQEVGHGNYKVIELELRSDCSEIQDVLLDMTGARTVPRVFIAGECIGGNSETNSMKQSGKLKRLLQTKGIV